MGTAWCPAQRLHKYRIELVTADWEAGQDPPPLWACLPWETQHHHQDMRVHSAQNGAWHSGGLHNEDVITVMEQDTNVLAARLQTSGARVRSWGRTEGPCRGPRRRAPYHGSGHAQAQRPLPTRMGNSEGLVRADGLPTLRVRGGDRTREPRSSSHKATHPTMRHHLPKSSKAHHDPTSYHHHTRALGFRHVTLAEQLPSKGSHLCMAASRRK